MKKLKINFKRALAGFLKEYLLEYVDSAIYSRKMYLQNTLTVFSDIPFETVIMRQTINIKDLKSSISESNELPYLVEEIKNRFAKEIVDKHIHIDPTKLIEFGSPFEKGIEIILRIQKPQVF